MRLFRTIAATTVALTAVMGSLLVNTSSAAAQGEPMCINRLRVANTEDILPDGDEPYLKLDGARKPFWKAPGSMDEEALATVNRTVHVGDVVEAFDSDGPTPPQVDDNFIGSDKVGRDGGTLHFQAENANYRASYVRGACT